MTIRRVRDVMTGAVVTVGPDTGYKEIVDALVDGAVSAVPVVDADDRVLGVVSEADLMRKVEFTGSGAQARIFEWRRRAAREKAGGDHAGALMSGPAVTIGPDASVSEAARTMDDRGVKRLPVVDEQGRLVGIVSRRDLLRDYLRPDAELRTEIIDTVLRRVLLIEPGAVDVDVDRGVVTMRGTTDRRTTAQIAVRLTHLVPGVVDVVDELTFQYDDTDDARRRYLFDARL